MLSYCQHITATLPLLAAMIIVILLFAQVKTNFQDCIDINAPDLLAALNKLKSNLICSTDALPPLFFKRLRYCLVVPLVIIFTQLLSVAFVPDVWKRAIIVPVHKKGSTKVISYIRYMVLPVAAPGFSIWGEGGWRGQARAPNAQRIEAPKEASSSTKH